MDKLLIPRNTNYKDLLCYKKSMVIYDLTYHFCKRFIDSKDRTYDQMIQAARSCKQNIVEGCIDMATSTASGLMLLNVARGSLRELLEDYNDYIRVRGENVWGTSSEEFKAMQRLGRQHSDSQYFIDIAQSRNDITVINMAIVLIKQCDYLLYNLIKSLSDKFTSEGGFKERMYHARVDKRGKTS
ncbi:MAG: four helix bundle protein [Rikenellaceae bacterium]|nr:four helix bundle protein [Rikenellaceae bacterium]